MKTRSLLVSLGLGLASSLLFSSCGSLQTAGGSGVPQMGPVFPGIASYVVVDTHDRKVVLANAADQRRPIASLTKIATAVVALDTVAALGGSLDEAMTIPMTAAVAGQSAVGLQPGDSISLRDALYCSLMASDNLAAEAIAEHLGGRILQRTGQGLSPIGGFMDQMNALASKLGMKQTKFINPHGLEQGNGVNLSSAADVARLSMHALSKGSFNFFVNQKQRKISYRSSSGQSRSFVVRNTNEILGQQRIDGIKTGTTNLAGPCLVITAPRPATVTKQADGTTIVIPHRLVVVELGAQDRFPMGLQLLQQGWAAYDGWQASGRQVLTAGELLSLPAAAAPAAAPAPAPAPAPMPPAPQYPY